MPLVAYKNLPTFERLKQEGRTILPPERAKSQDIREMHVGLLNMMPDSALQATERQFFRLVGESNQIAQLYIHPFTLPELERSKETQEYINEHYETFEEIKAQGLDALIITGANLEDPILENNTFWEPLKNVIDWSWSNVTSTLCSCLATHALMQFKYNQKRSPIEHGKLWGVYRHRILKRTHPLVRNMNTVFDVPHSRHNAISQKQFDGAGMKTLIASKDAGTHIAVSPDGFRHICMQGHPEYDTISLLKEYIREVKRYTSDERKDLPPYPEHYFNEQTSNLINKKDLVQLNDHELQSLSHEMQQTLENTWTDSARSIIASWIGLVYQITNADRKKQFMEGVDPKDPLKNLY